MGTVVKRLQRGTSCEYLKSHQILGMIHSNFITKCEFSSQEAKNLPVFKFFPFGLFVSLSKAIETTRNQLVKAASSLVMNQPLRSFL